MANSMTAKMKVGRGKRTTIDALLRNGSGGPTPKAALTGIQKGMKDGSTESKHSGNARKSIGALKRSN